MISTLNAVAFAHETWTLRRWLIHWLAIFSIWTWGKTIDFKAALKSELPRKRNSTSRARELLLQPQPRADVQCFEELSQTPLITALLLKWHSLSYHIRLNFLITCSCHFTVNSDRLGWSHPHPSSHFSPQEAEQTPPASHWLCADASELSPCLACRSEDQTLCHTGEGRSLASAAAGRPSSPLKSSTAKLGWTGQHQPQLDLTGTRQTSLLKAEREFHICRLQLAELISSIYLWNQGSPRGQKIQLVLPSEDRLQI